MKQLRALGLVASALLSFNVYAEDTYIYRQEFELFRQSDKFNMLIKDFIDMAADEMAATEASESLDATQRSTMLTTLADIDFIITCPESLAALNDFLDRMCDTYQMERPLIIVMNRSLSLGEAMATQFEQNNVLIIEKDLLLKATDKEIEAALSDKLNVLKQQVAATSASTQNQAANEIQQ